jgi:hypothetical protein
LSLPPPPPRPPLAGADTCKPAASRHLAATGLPPFPQNALSAGSPRRREHLCQHLCHTDTVKSTCPAVWQLAQDCVRASEQLPMCPSSKPPRTHPEQVADQHSPGFFIAKSLRCCPLHLFPPHLRLHAHGGVGKATTSQQSFYAFTIAAPLPPSNTHPNPSLLGQNPAFSPPEERLT